jgi:hypothetical protein
LGAGDHHPRCLVSALAATRNRGRLSLPSATPATGLGECTHRRIETRARAPQAAIFLNPAALAKIELLQVLRSRKSALSWWSIAINR